VMGLYESLPWDWDFDCLPDITEWPTADQDKVFDELRRRREASQFADSRGLFQSTRSTFR